MKNPVAILRTALFSVFFLSSCGGEGLTDDGEEPAEDSAEVPSAMPDLPCGGADILTDDLNCGACGNECDVMWSETKYAAGGCVDGECGPIWSGIFTVLPPPDSLTCEQLCGFGGRACVPGGCSGMTGFVCVVAGDSGDQCDLGDALNKAKFEMTGACEEVPPYPGNLEPGFYPYLNCCCERP